MTSRIGTPTIIAKIVPPKVYVATDGQTDFALDYPVGSKYSIEVERNGVLQHDNHSLAGTRLVRLDDPCTAGDVIVLRTRGLEGLVNVPNPGSVVADSLSGVAADVAAMRTKLGLGTAALKNVDALGDLGGVTSLNGGPLAGLRNLIINGAVKIAVRGSSFTIAAGTVAYTADRWRIDNQTNQTLTVAVDESGAFEGTGRLRLSFATAPTSGYVYVQQRIEDVRTLGGKSATLSAYVASAEQLTVTGFLDQYFGSGGSAYVSNAVFSSATPADGNYARMSGTVALASTAGKTFGTDHFLLASMALPMRSTSVLSVSCVQTEEGPVATPFERRPLGLELALCQRYTRRLASGASFNGAFGAGYAHNATTARIQLPGGAHMRTTPTLIISNVADFNILDSTANHTVTGIAPLGLNPDSQSLIVTTSGLTTGQGVLLADDGSASAVILLDAEL